MRTLIATAHHRNGVDGVPFDVVLFTDEDGTRKVAISFDDNWPGGSPRVAVLDVDKLAEGNIAFGLDGNSHRGDVYARDVRRWIVKGDAP